MISNFFKGSIILKQQVTEAADGNPVVWGVGGGVWKRCAVFCMISMFILFIWRRGLVLFCRTSFSSLFYLIHLDSVITKCLFDV